MVAPPRDARYTLFCLDVDGPDHTAQANRVKSLWQQATGRSEWYVIHQESNSIVYFGYYRSYKDPSDPRENARAMSDREFVTGLKDSIGDQPFGQALFVPLDAPDPTAPPEWNLVNARGFWSVEIASCTGQDRKARAVDAVREARAEGIDAFYFHGPSASSICIGAWPEEAIKKQQTDVAENRNADEGIAVIPGAMASQVPGEVTDKDGTRMKVLHDQMEVQDPTLAATINKYPLHSVNGFDEKGKPSAIVRIPHKQDEPMAGNLPPLDLLGGAPSVQSAPPPAAGGRLRSLGQ